MLNNKNILVTGATGSFGKAFVRTVIKYPNIKKIVIFSEMSLNNLNFKKIKPENIKCLDIFLVMLKIKKDLI